MRGALVVGSTGLIGRLLMRRLPEFFRPVTGAVIPTETANTSGPVILDLSIEIPQS